MKYIVINLYRRIEIDETITTLLKAGYVFSTYRRDDTVRSINFDSIGRLFRSLPSSISLGERFCKKHWNIYSGDTFFDDANYKIVTVNEFLSNYTDFEPEMYKKLIPK